MDWVSPATIGGLLVTVLTGATLAALVAGQLNVAGRGLAVLVGIAIGGIIFQAGHVVDQGIGLGYWAVNASEASPLTPWAGGLRDGMAWLFGSLNPEAAPDALGAEVLQLFGNTIFLVAVAAMAMMVVNTGIRLRSVEGMRAALVVQGLHVAEQLLLTGTLLFSGEARGVSTGFGVIDDAGYRLFFQFTISLAATAFSVRALASMHRYGLLELHPALLPSRELQLEPARVRHSPLL